MPATSTPRNRSSRSSKSSVGKTLRPVTPDDLARLTMISSPTVSPDGSAIAFVTRRFGDKNDYASDIHLARLTPKADPALAASWIITPLTTGHKDSSPRFAPTGHRLAFISSRDKAKPQIYTIPLAPAAGEATPLTRFPEGSIRDFKWTPDARHLIVAFRPTDPDRTAEAAKLRQEKNLSDPPWVVEDIFYREDGDGYFGHARYALYLVDAATGDHTPLYTQDTLGTMTYDVSPDSRTLVVATDRRKDAAIAPADDELLLIDLRSRKIRPITNLPQGCKAYPHISPDGSTIAYAGHTGTDGLYATNNIHLYTCPATPGPAIARNLTKSSDYCLVAGAFTDTGDPVFHPILAWTPDSKSILAQIAHHGTTHVARIPRKGLAPGESPFLTRGDAMITLGNVSNTSTLALTRATHDNPGDLCVATLPKSGPLKLTQLTTLNRELLRTLAIAKPTAHWVTTPDNTRVHTWVMEPPGPPKRTRRPAILMIHGGPHAQYGVGWFHEFQCLASAGYTVVFTNPRGSRGYGQSHTEAIRGDWGNKDWIDLQAVLKFMQEHPRIDPARLGVEGGSYGGYMTCWIVGRCRDFKAAISDRCVANLVSMGGNSDYADPPDRYWPGNFWDQIDARWAQSPIKDFGKVKTPMLVIHSEGDLRCNVEQSEQVYAALKLRKVPTRFVRYPRTCSHGLSRSGPPDMRLHRLKEIMRWWGERL